MGLEKEIRQPSFRNDYQKATLNLLFTNSWLQDKLSSFFKQFDLTTQQYNVLRILKGQHPRPLSTAGLRERLLDKMSDASRIVDRMYKKGLVERCTSKRDKRLVDVLLSEKGFEVLETLEDSVEHLDSLLYNLTPDETTLLNQLLDKIRGN